MLTPSGELLTFHGGLGLYERVYTAVVYYIQGNSGTWQGGSGVGSKARQPLTAKEIDAQSRFNVRALRTEHSEHLEAGTLTQNTEIFVARCLGLIP